jgi:hypothetical protein
MKNFKEPFIIRVGKVTKNDNGKTKYYTTKKDLKNTFIECDNLAKDYKDWHLSENEYLHIEALDNNGSLVYLLRVDSKGEKEIYRN